MSDASLDATIADAILGVDTLWGGDVMNPSGTGRFIADSWCSDEQLPTSYTHPAAGALRAAGGLSAAEVDREAVAAYLDAVDVAASIHRLVAEAGGRPGPRGAFLDNLGESLEVMWDLGMEALGLGEPVPYDRSVRAATGAEPGLSEPGTVRERLGSLLASAGYPADSEEQLLQAVDAWRAERLVPSASIGTLARAFIAELDAGVRAHMLPHLPDRLHEVPRSNVEFMAIRDAFFSGSMNYVGRARTPAGRPLYEATYEINASLQISVPEFCELVSHEVVPGHVTTFAYAQHLFVLGEAGFEATVLTMNSPYATLAEGIANNALLMAHGVTEIEDLPDADLQVGALLSVLQDEAKNQASYLTYVGGLPQPEVAEALRRDFVVSNERADKLSGAWARHPLLGRMNLPAYRAGTHKVAALRREHPPEVILPALYGCRGLVDIATIDSVL